MINSGLTPIDGATAVADFDQNERITPVPKVAVSAGERALIRRLKGAVESAQADGFKVSPETANAFEVVEAVEGFKYSVPGPNIAGMTPGEVTDFLNGYIDGKARAAVAGDARALVLAHAVTELQHAVRDDVNALIGFYREPYRKAADEYARVHDVVVRFPTVGEAAMADQTGKTVSDWYSGRNAAAEVERIVSVIMPFVYENPGTEDHYDQAIGLMARDISDPAQLAFALPELQRGTTTAPFGRLPLITIAGGTLVLPEDREEWINRLEVYRIDRDIQLAGLFRDDDE